VPESLLTSAFPVNAAEVDNVLPLQTSSCNMTHHPAESCHGLLMLSLISRYVQIFFGILVCADLYIVPFMEMNLSANF